MRNLGYILLLFLFSQQVLALESSSVELPYRNVHYVTEFEVFIDSSNSLAYDDLKNVEFQKVNPNTKVSFNCIDNTWIRFKTPERFKNSESISFMIDQSNIDSVDYYFKNKITGEVGQQSLGNDYIFKKRNYLTNHLIFDVDSNVDNNDLILRLRNNVGVHLNIIVAEEKSIIQEEMVINMLFGIFLGVIVVMAMYNMFLYISIGERVYIIYVAHTIFVGILQSSISGFSYQFFWPNYPMFQNYSIELFTILTSVAGLLFMMDFLKTEIYVEREHKITKGVIVLYLLALIILPFNHSLINSVLKVIQPIIAIWVIYIAVRVYFKGYSIAKFYLFAWSMLMVGIIIFSLAEVGVIQRGLVSNIIMPLGSALEVILLSLALANNINVLKKEQAQAVENTLRLETEKAIFVKEQNTKLEKKVFKRTKELEEANNVLESKNTELSDAYTDLKNTQSQLVHAEKMSSLGQLTAGIAHEINNPINFVSSNILPLKRDIADIISIFEQTENFVGGKLDPNDFKEIQELKEQFDYDYILKEIDQLLDGMSDGANRTVEIIRGLKLFSRVDEDDLKRVNLEDGINSTLILLNSAVKHHVDLVKNFGEIPEVECYGGKMNQVFMNIISNAIQAIRETGMEDGKIIITTSQENDLVHISIADNGPGMTEEIKQKLFEPFFTTKPVGEGTGLGLSIVYKIIDKINGKIEVNTEPGKGTEFIITLPITNTTKD